MAASIDGPTHVIASIGYAARGVVYLIISFFSALAALGLGQAEDSSGALKSLLGSSVGSILLIIIAVGLVCYAAWRLMQALADLDEHGKDLRGLTVRGGLLVSAITHSLLAIAIASWLILGASDDGDTAKNWSSKILEWPGGEWIVLAIGVAVAGAGIAHLWKGIRSGFKRWFEIDEALIRWLGPIFQLGLIIRGVIFVLIGVFFGIAAWQHSADTAKGFKDTLQMIAEQPYGPYLMGGIAIGLFAFACYSLAEAVYRDVQGLDKA